MASSVEFAEYVCGQAEGAGEVSYRKCLESTVFIWTENL